MGEQVLQRAGLLEHPGAHALRADRLHGDAAVAVGHREPLGEADRGVLGHRVRRAADHRQQARGRGGHHEPPALAAGLGGGDPLGHQQPGGAHVGHHVDVDDPLPHVVGGLQAVGAAGPVDAGVGQVDVDAAELGGGLLDQGAHARVGGAVAGHGDRADLLGRAAYGVGVEVVDHDPGALGDQAGGQRATDAAGGAGDDRPAAGQRLVAGHHTPPVRVTPPSMSRVWPVTQSASSESRKATAPATSSGTPRRLSGYCEDTSSSRPS